MSIHHRSILESAGLKEEIEKQELAGLLLQLSKVDEKVEEHDTKVTWRFDENFWNRYKILPKKIGSGGFGTVFVGIDQQSKRKVAVKIMQKVPKHIDNEIILSKQLLKSKKECPSFLVCYIDHALINYPINSNEKKYAIVFEYIVGQDLADMVEKDEQGFYKHIDSARLKKLFCSALKGLAELHEQRIAHRDIKMENLRIDKDDQIYYLDFGHACFSDRHPKCNTHMLVGTPCVTLSYEGALQLNQPHDENYAFAEDVYSLASAFYPLFTGKDPPACVLEDNLNTSSPPSVQKIAELIIEATDKKMFAEESEILKFIGEKDKNLAQIFLRMLMPYSKDRPTAKEAHDAVCEK